ncbi:MAG: ATP-binding protein [Stagnimonas sp.]|nr:ATP-binding protein [Stagnimonas sp.]
MNRLKLATAATVLLLVAAGAALLSRQGLDDRDHEQFQEALQGLKQLDAGFNKDLLRVRYALLSTYDDFLANERDSAQALDTLARVPDLVGAGERQAILDGSAETKSLLAHRTRLFERFKSQNAVVTNSRHYLPFAIQQLLEQLGPDTADRELATSLHALTASVLAVLTSDNSDRTTEYDEALSSARRLQDWLTRHPGHPQAGAVGSLISHAHTLVSGTGKLDQLTRELLALPVATALGKLSHTYEAAVGGAIQRAQDYRRMLYLLAGLLLLLVAYAVNLLRNANQSLERRVQERTAELAGSERRFRTLAAAAPVGIFLTDASGAVVYTNLAAQAITGLPPERNLGSGWISALHPDDYDGTLAWWRQLGEQADDRPWECRFRTPDGQTRNVLARLAAVHDEQGATLGYVGTLEDITERLRITSELHQAQKLESVGRLAAGVAHEINTPVQFVSDSCHFIRDGLGDLRGLVQEYRDILAALGEGSLLAPAALDRARLAEQRADLDYLLDNMPTAVERSLEGLQRVSTIVRSMKEFAHPDQKEMAHADLNQAILSTLTIARNEYKYIAELKTELGELPPVPCFLGDLNQAVLNIVVNAAHAIADFNLASGATGLITVRTRCENQQAVIDIEDSGGGIPDAIRDKIFDPFFTTKAVGKGTGQGLAIARSVVVDKHHGSLSVESWPGSGSCFTIRVPLDGDTALTTELA